MCSEERNLFHEGLNFNTDEQALEDQFKGFRPMSEVAVVKAWETQQYQVFGFTAFPHPEHASDAMTAMTGESLDGPDPFGTCGKSARGTRGVHLGPMGMATATLEVVGTKAMRVTSTTVDLEDMDIDMDMGGPETMVAEARVVMDTTQEEITDSYEN
ncbi:hypothetical protein HJG60_010482 [Phyllostomus discolor]|uniref:RRM domain-containing protein n=1 Tax=Phyllostomus discolor TaxID=89673 RepID=A0A834EB81_9CHIR|nr:hypothetical protein HJG60_010482 [Phyllostomus discolor]